MTSLFSYYLFIAHQTVTTLLAASFSFFTTTSAYSVQSASEYGSPSSDPAPLGPFNNADVVMILLTLSVIVRVVNFHFFQIPSSIAMAFGAILVTVLLLFLSYFPWLGVASAIEALRAVIKDFPDLLLKYMLGFLLFAAAIEVDLRNLGRILTTVLALSVVSTILSTLIVGTLTYFLMQNIAHMDFAWCLLFGAIVSPTDPITVMSILNDKPDLLPSSTRYFVIGESLLNDAVGVVLYLVLLEIVRRPDIGAFEIATLIFETVIVECVYGAAIGVFLAWLAYSAIVSVREPLLEVVITFVLVGNINMFCRILNASIPLASVGAGLFIGNYAVTFAMNDETTETFHEMWKLADETLNSILFLMIGAADLFWNPQDLGWIRVLTLVVCTISISIVARFLAVALPLFTIIFLEWATGRRLRHFSVRYRGGTIAVLTWAGMRGGISIALALGVPDSFVKHAVPGHMTYGQLIFFMTFILVVFSILVQGMLFEPVVKMITRVSFDIFSSGGLGTYVSSTSLGNGFNNEFTEYDGMTPEDSFVSGGERLWDSGGQQLYADYLGEDTGTDEALLGAAGGDSGEGYGAIGMGESVRSGDASGGSGSGPPPPLVVGFPPRLISASASRLDGDFGRRISDIGMGKREMLGHLRGSHLAGQMVTSTEHARQGSITFQNLPMLEEPPSIPAFLGDLRRRGTHGFARLFDRSRLPDVSNEHESHPLRRSKTEPDNARLARGEKPEGSDSPPPGVSGGVNFPGSRSQSLRGQRLDESFA